MAKINKVSSETKSAIRRKSAYTLPNNPTDSGYKADDIRRAFWQPIVDISQSAVAEVDRVVDEVNEILESASSEYDTITGIFGEYYHSSKGFVYSKNNDSFMLKEFEGEETNIEIPSAVLYQGVAYPINKILSGAFTKIATIKLPYLITIESGAFVSGTSFNVPKENLSNYKTMLSGFTVNGYDTIKNNANDIKSLKSGKLDKDTSTNANYRAYVVSPSGANIRKELSQSGVEGKIPMYRSNGRMGVGTPSEDDDAIPKKLFDETAAKHGATIVFSIDPETYIITLGLVNEKGKVLDTKSVDLPLESMVVGATYENGNVYLNVQGQEEPLVVDVSDLIAGLVNEQTFNEQIDRLDKKADGINTSVVALEQYMNLSGVYGFGAFYSEESEKARNYVGGGSIDRKFKEIDKEVGTDLQVSLNDNYILSINLKNKKGQVISTQTVDFPIEGLITGASYKNKVLTLTLQNGNKVNVDISDIISGLVPETRTVNGKALKNDITLSAEDVGAYSKSETYSQTQTDTKIKAAKTELQESVKDEIEESVNEKNFAGYAMESEKTYDCIKGGALDRRLEKIEKALNNNS